MRTMTENEVVSDWNGLQKRHRAEIATKVARYCVGNSMHDVAKWLKYSRSWVQKQLDTAGIVAACGEAFDPEEGAIAVAPLTGETANVAREIPLVLQKYAPTEKEQAGEAFASYLEHYEADYGQGSDIAKRLAKAEYAGTTAIEKGEIKEIVNKQQKKVHRIELNNESTFDLSLQHHTAHVIAASKFLDTAKINFLKKESTCQKVAAAHAKWLEQVERIRNFHPTFNEVE